MTMKDFCGNSSFWNVDVFKEGYPQFTDCFITTAPVWLPVLCLLIAFAYDRLVSQKAYFHQQSFHVASIFQTGLCVVLCLLNIFELLSNLYSGYNCNEKVGVPVSYFVAVLLNVASFIFVAIVTQLNRRRGNISSWYLWSYWIIYVMCSVVPLLSKILYRPTCTSSITFYVSFGVACVQLIIYSAVDNANVTGYNQIHSTVCPVQYASIISKLCFSWYTPTVKTCFKKTIIKTDLWEQPSSLKAEENVTDIVAAWDREKASHKASRDSKHQITYKSVFKSNEETPLLQETRPEGYKTEKEDDQPSLFRCCIRIYGMDWLRSSVLYILGDLAILVTPMFLRIIIEEVEKPESSRTIWYSVLISILYFLFTQLKVVTSQMSIQLVFSLSLRVKMALIGLIYQKSLRVNSSTRKHYSTGEIVSFVSVDCQRIYDSLTFSQMLSSLPLVGVIACIEIWEPMGISLLGCIAAIFGVLALNMLFGKLRRTFFVKILQFKGKRIKLFGEVINGMKILKMYTWEPVFSKMIETIRSKEVKNLFNLALVNGGNQTSNNISSFLMNLVMLIIYWFVSSQPYDAVKAFSVLAILNIIRGPLAIMPIVLSNIIQALVALRRIQDYLLTPEISHGNVNYLSESDNAVSIENADFKWDKENTELILKGLNVKIEKGKLVAVVGLVGSGKSSFISSILGEMEKIRGTVDVQGSIAYVSQEAWMQNMTIRENILYGKKYDSKKYKKTIQYCSLKPDLNILQGGDSTEIGQRGINLSGGQKQRINLARAVYNDADIYLLDDPLSAVDAHVGKDLFQDIIGPNGVLKNKTRILVTHGVQWLPSVDEIIVIDGGRISERGTFKQLVDHDGSFAQFLKQYFLQDDISDDDDEDIQQVKNTLLEKLDGFKSDGFTSDEEFRLRKRKRRRSFSRTLSIGHESTMSGSFQLSQKFAQDEGRLIQEETSQIGMMKFQDLIDYFKAMGTVPFAMAILFLLISITMGILSNFWITFWTTDPFLLNSTLTTTTTYKDKEAYYLWLYALIGFLQGVTFFVFQLFLLRGFVNASSRIHQRMLNCIMRCPMSFFDTTPYGRIVNRFSSDIDTLDERFQRFGNFFTIQAGLLLSSLIVIVIESPYILAVVVPVGVLYVLVIRFYLPANLQLKRLEAVARSPVFNHFSETISGVSVIRAYRSKSRFIKELYTRMDQNTALYFASNTGFGYLPKSNRCMDCWVLDQIVSKEEDCSWNTIERNKEPDVLSTNKLTSTTNQAFENCVSDIISFVKDLPDTPRTREKVRTRFRKRMYNPNGYEKTKWIGIRTQTFGNLINLAAALFVVLSSSIGGADAGLSLSYALQISFLMTMVVQSVSMLQMDVISIERVVEYTKLSPEALWFNANKPPAKWPSKGRLDFHNYKTKYRPELDLVLKGIDLRVDSGEKIGVVGRTGAGKSSLTLSIFRLIERTEGEIRIDKIDIADLGLHDLRSQIAILPQDPVIFSLSLRQNLDPKNEFTDSQIWNALEYAHLKQYIASQNKLLDSEFGEGGGSLSVGQRQLLCLARTLLHKKKILILDEATAAVDMETDDLIQQTIRSQFTDCTVISIAHRLNTIMDYDKILVMNDGFVSQYDTPHTLLQNGTGLFYSLAKEAGIV